MINLNYYFRLMRLDKPIGTLLLLWPIIAALVIASDGVPEQAVFIVFVIGVFLTRSAGCVLNDYADYKIDPYVLRTHNRPLATGKVSRKSALILGLTLSLIALILALIFLKLRVIVLAIPAFFLLATYPYTKRFLPMPQAYLGLAFSFGIFMVYFQVVGELEPSAWLLFWANFFWVLGYDTVYALSDMEDDMRIGVKSSAITLGKFVVPFVGLCYFTSLLFLYELGIELGYRLLYWYAIVIIGMTFSYQLVKIKSFDRKVCFEMFKLNNWVGIALIIGILAQYSA